MFSIFSRCITKGPIELDAALVILVESIRSNLIRPRRFDKIDQPGENDEVEPVNLSDFYTTRKHDIIEGQKPPRRAKICQKSTHYWRP
jgi:hypothetical protein